VARRPAEETAWAVSVRQAKRGRARRVPLSRRALEALVDWRDARPVCASDRVFVSLPPAGREPAPLSADAIGQIVARHAARAGLPPQLRAAHVLRHTFCTLLAERGVALEVIAELAGHADVRTTRAYVSVAERRLEAAIADTFDRGRSGLARARRPSRAAGQ
jgi:integrase/recombinase XerD